MIEIVSSLFTAFKSGFGKNLTENEQVIAQSKVHWGIVLVPVGIIFLGLLIRINAQTYFFINFLPDKLMTNLPPQIQDMLIQTIGSLSFNPLKWVSYAVSLYGLWRLYKAVVTYFTTTVMSTQHRLFITTGLFRNQDVEILWSQVDALHITKSPVGQFLNYGGVVIHSVGGMTTKIPALENPNEFHSEIMHLRFS